MTSLIERRYAEALVEMALQEGDTEAFSHELHYAVALLYERKDIRRFLLNPEVRASAKKDAVIQLLAGRSKAVLINFLLLLIDKRRFGFLPGISKEFGILADKRENILNLTIISAVPLEVAQTDRIRDKYARIYGAGSSKAKLAMDETLIGGVKVVIGDNVIDGSVRGRLESLKQALTM